jgi:hypothetical protein
VPIEEHPEDQRHVLARHIQSNPPSRFPDALLVGFTTIAEWVDRDGHRWLSYLTSPGATECQIDGYLQHVTTEGWEQRDRRWEMFYLGLSLGIGVTALVMFAWLA